VERFGEGFRKDGVEDGREGEESDEGVEEDGRPPGDQALPDPGFDRTYPLPSSRVPPRARSPAPIIHPCGEPEDRYASSIAGE